MTLEKRNEKARLRVGGSLLLRWLFLSCLAASLTGCRTHVKDANALAKQTSETADKLEAYYSALSVRSADFGVLNHVGQPDQEYLSGAVNFTIANRLLSGDLAPLVAGAQPNYLAAHLKQNATPVDSFFRQRLAEHTRDLLQQYDGHFAPTAELNGAITTDLNQHMDGAGEAWYTFLNSDLQTVVLSDEAKALIAQVTMVGGYTLFSPASPGAEPVTGRQRRVTINRLILDSAYPHAIKPPLYERLEAQQIALGKRQQMAHQLKSLGDALQTLTGSDAADKVKEAAAKLQKQIEEVNHHPLSIASSDPVIQKILSSKQVNLDPSVLAAQLAHTLAEIQQEREFRRVLPKVDTFLQQLTGFFQAEEPAYLSISANYLVAVGRHNMESVDDPTLAIVTIDAKTFEPYNIKAEVQPQSGTNGKTNAKMQIEQATYQNITTVHQEVENLAGELDALHQAFVRFLNRNKAGSPAKQDVTVAPMPSIP